MIEDLYLTDNNEFYAIDDKGNEKFIGKVKQNQNIPDAQHIHSGVTLKRQGRDLRSQVIVQSKDDLQGTLDSTKVYVINGVIDMDGQPIEVPASGLTIVGLDVNISVLTSTTDNYTLFTSPSEGSGNLFLHNVSARISGSGSKVFALTDATGSNACEMENVNLENCTSLGYLDEYRQGLMINWFIFNCADGLEMRGEWAGGFRATTGLVRLLGSSATVFKAGAGLLFNGRFLTDMNADIPSGAVGIDFTSNNFVNKNSFEISNAIFSGDGDYIPNTTEGNVKSLWSSNAGVNNTYKGGIWSCTTETETTITTQDTFVKIAGTTTYRELQHCSQTTNNAIIYDGSDNQPFKIVGSITFSGNSNTVIKVKIRVYDDSASAYVDYQTFQAKIASGASGTRTENISILDVIEMDANDRLELWVANASGTSNITMNLGGNVVMSER